MKKFILSLLIVVVMFSCSKNSSTIPLSNGDTTWLKYKITYAPGRVYDMSSLQEGDSINTWMWISETYPADSFTVPYPTAWKGIIIQKEGYKLTKARDLYDTINYHFGPLLPTDYIKVQLFVDNKFYKQDSGQTVVITYP